MPEPLGFLKSNARVSQPVQLVDLIVFRERVQLAELEDGLGEYLRQVIDVLGVAGRMDVQRARGLGVDEDDLEGG